MQHPGWYNLFNIIYISIIYMFYYINSKSLLPPALQVLQESFVIMITINAIPVAAVIPAADSPL